MFNSFASIKSKQISASSIAFKVRSTENFSIPTSCLPGLRIPAVSMISIVFSLNLISVRFVSRVVPATFATIACCFPAIVLKRYDFPAFGRPTKATRITSSGCFSSLTFGIFSAISVRSSSTPALCSAEVRIIGLIPSRKNSSFGKFPFKSVLFKTKITGFRDFKAFFAIKRSSFEKGLVLSRTTKINSLASTAS